MKNQPHVALDSKSKYAPNIEGETIALVIIKAGCHYCLFSNEVRDLFINDRSSDCPRVRDAKGLKDDCSDLLFMTSEGLTDLLDFNLALFEGSHGHLKLLHPIKA